MDAMVLRSSSAPRWSKTGYDVTAFAYESPSRKSIDTSTLITGSFIWPTLHPQEEPRDAEENKTSNNSKSKHAKEL